VFGLAESRDIPDEEVMKNFQNGDSKAFNTLLDRYGSRILFFIMKKLSMPKQQAEDLLQEIFIKVIEKRNSYDSNKKFSTWLYTVANNRCIDHLRVEANKTTSSLDKEVLHSTSGTTHMELIKSRDRNPDEKTYDREIKVYLNKALNELKDNLKEVFLLREIEGLSLNEISDVTGTPLNTVKTRLRTAYINLRLYLIENGYIYDEHDMGSVK